MAVPVLFAKAAILILSSASRKRKPTAVPDDRQPSSTVAKLAASTTVCEVHRLATPKARRSSVLARRAPRTAAAMPAHPAAEINDAPSASVVARYNEIAVEYKIFCKMILRRKKKATSSTQLASSVRRHRAFTRMSPLLLARGQNSLPRRKSCIASTPGSWYGLLGTSVIDLHAILFYLFCCFVFIF